LDKASGILSYKIKELHVVVNEQKESLILRNEEETKEIDIAWLQKNPSTIFKEMLGLLDAKSGRYIRRGINNFIKYFGGIQ
jgi:hypothetical protein